MNNNIHSNLDITVSVDSSGLDPYDYVIEQYNESLRLRLEHRNRPTDQQTFLFGTLEEAQEVASKILFAVESIRTLRGMEQ